MRMGRETSEPGQSSDELPGSMPRRLLELRGVQIDIFECKCSAWSNKPGMKSILKKAAGGQGGEYSQRLSRSSRETCTIVDDQEELRAEREAQKILEAKAHEMELRVQRRNQLMLRILMMPVRAAAVIADVETLLLVTYIGSCFLASPMARQLWLYATLLVCLFELWSCALFWAFSRDPNKLYVLEMLLHLDHWANAWFLVDALLQALDKIRGGEVQEPSDGNSIMRKVDRQQQLTQKARTLFTRLPGFSSCSSEFLLKIVDVGSVVSKKKGEVLYSEHDDNTSLFLILEGEVIFRDGEGGTLGEFKVFDLEQANTEQRVEVVTDCEVFELPEAAMKRFLEYSPADRSILTEFYKAKLQELETDDVRSCRRSTTKLFRSIAKFFTSGVQKARSIWLQAVFAVLLIVVGSLAHGLILLRLREMDAEGRAAEGMAENLVLLLFMICKLMRQNLPLTYLKRFFSEQETQMYVNIRLQSSSGSMWVTVKLAVIMLGWGHWVGCIFLLLSFLREATSDGLQDSHFMQLHQYTRIAEPTDSEWWGNYLAAYYKAFNRNYEGSMPERLEEFVLILFVAAGLLAMKSYVIGSFFKLQETKKDLAREVQQLLNQAQLVCDSLDLPPSIRKAIRQHMMFQWSKARDVGNREVVLKTFAPDLQKKVKEQVTCPIYLPIIQANEKLFNGASSDFMLQIIDQLEAASERDVAVVVLQPSEFLFCENDAPQVGSGYEMYTFAVGYVCEGGSVLSGDGHSHDHIAGAAGALRQKRFLAKDRPNEPTAVGEVSFLLKMPHLYSVRSRSGVESSILKITTDNFELIMSNLDQLLHNVAQSMKLSMNGTDLKKGAVVHDGQDETEFFQHMRESVRQMNCDGRTAMHLAAAEGRENAGSDRTTVGVHCLAGSSFELEVSCAETGWFVAEHIAAGVGHPAETPVLSSVKTSPTQCGSFARSSTRAWRASNCPAAETKEFHFTGFLCGQLLGGRHLFGTF
ncbi:unnamed protein product [Symbiodinium sp. KB8]|nr:unnamed protein product [Symbiodinium sp. KB8]